MALKLYLKGKKYGNYHLLQPIAMVGYNPNRSLVIPEFSLIPSFLFYYAVEFDNIKDFDAALSLFIEIGIEVGAFFATGGMASLRHLRHIKHITKLNKARKSLLAPADEVLVWRGLDSVSTTVSFTSSMLTSFFGYIDDTANQDEELTKNLKLFFLVLTFTSLGAGVFSRYKTISAADDVLKRMDELTTQGTPANLTQETIDVIKAVRNSGDVLFSLFKNRISGYTAAELGEANKLFTTFNTFSVDAQKEFWRHFGRIEDINFWKKMNKNNADLTKAWDEIIHFKNSRQYIGYLESYRYIGLIHVKTKLIEVKSINGKWVGGHFGPALFDTTKPIYGVIDANAIVFNTYKGTRTYKQVRKTSFTFTDGTITKRKQGWHTWIEGITEKEYVEDIAFAFFKK